jgi:uncharacterized protein (TIGR02246 family)
MARQIDMADLAAIMALKARYCRFLDTKDWQAYASLFTDDFELDSVPDQEPIRGRDAAMQSIRSFVEHAQTAHQVHSPEISIDGDSADVIWAMQDRVIGAAHLDESAHTGYGHYYERYVRQDGEWRIARLKLRYVIFEREPREA